MKVLHIITGLDQGGAEETLFKLIKNNNSNDHIIVSLKNFGVYGERFQKINKKKSLSIKYS